jgi:hypothetical protein
LYFIFLILLVYIVWFNLKDSVSNHGITFLGSGCEGKLQINMSMVWCYHTCILLY